MHFYIIFVPQFSFFDSLFLLLNSHSSIFVSQIFNSHSSKSENQGAKFERELKSSLYAGPPYLSDESA